MMIRSLPHNVALAAHPKARSPSVCGVHVRLAAAPGGCLALTYSLAGELCRLRIPHPLPPIYADGLWRHTCFEVFVAVKGKAAYAELNLAPSGQWAAYAFRSYRDGAPLPQEMNPEIAVRRLPAGLELDAVVRLDRLLPSRRARSRLRVGLSAVVEDEAGVLSYWAIAHPPGAPDFHHPHAFALELDTPQMAAISDPAPGVSP